MAKYLKNSRRRKLTRRKGGKEDTCARIEWYRVQQETYLGIALKSQE